MPEQDITNIINVIIDTAVITLVIILITILCFLPGIVAGIRKHPQKLAIFFLNLFMGFTVFGWLAAFVWAFTNSSTARKPTIAEELKELAQLKKQGIISEEEFQVTKNKLLNS